MLFLPEKIETDRLVLQRLKYEDAEEIFYAYASKSEATRYVSWPTHTRVQDTNKYLAFAVPAWKAQLEFNFTIRLRSTNSLIGSIGCINDAGKMQFGYIISPSSWGRGYATEACRSMLNHICQLTYVYRIWTFVDVENVRSMAVLRKCGLVEEARIEKWHRFVNQGSQPKDCILFKYPMDKP